MTSSRVIVRTVGALSSILHGIESVNGPLDLCKLSHVSASSFLAASVFPRAFALSICG